MTKHSTIEKATGQAQNFAFSCIFNFSFMAVVGRCFSLLSHHKKIDDEEKREKNMLKSETEEWFRSILHIHNFIRRSRWIHNINIMKL